MTPNPMLEPTAASGLRALAGSSSPRSSAVAQHERSAARRVIGEQGDACIRLKVEVHIVGRPLELRVTDWSSRRRMGERAVVGQSPR